MLEIEVKSSVQYFASDENNFYLSLKHGHEKLKVSTSGIISALNIIPKNPFNYRTPFFVNLHKKILLVGSYITIENEILRNRFKEDRLPWLFRPDNYRNTYRSMDFFVTKIPFTGKEPKLILPNEILEKKKLGNGILIYNLRTGEYKMLELPFKSYHVAITLNNLVIAAIMKHPKKIGVSLIRMYDNDLF